MNELSARWVVSGQVQGVGFRWFTARLAEQLGVAGWVSNLPDGRVEVVARGPAEALTRLDEALRAGPRMASVEGVEKSDIPHELVHHNSFDIR